MDMLPMLAFYFLLALPGLLFLSLIYWAFKKSRIGRSAKIFLFSTSAVIVLAPFVVQVDAAVALAPAYLSAIPILIDGELQHFVRVFMSQPAFHFFGILFIGFTAIFVSYCFLFRESSESRGQSR